ncbi:MAG: phosphatase PAP2 family protein [Acidimicrobiia bacterium]
MHDVDPGAPAPRSRRIRHGWVLEVLGGVLVYFVYDWLRDRATGASADALRHAKDIVSAEQFLGLYHERALQHAFVGHDWFLSFWNIYYGTIHFVLPVVALVWLYRSWAARYLLYRNTLLFMLGFALVGFVLYPLTPPRLMPAHYGFVDTAARYFNFGPQVRVTFDAAGQPSAAAAHAFGNLFAAMPSLHVGWSTWVALALWPLVRRWWGRALLALYPVTILFCIVVTANHWILDAVGGWVVLALGYGCARAVAARAAGRRVRQQEESTTDRSEAVLR